MNTAIQNNISSMFSLYHKLIFVFLHYYTHISGKYNEFIRTILLYYCCQKAVSYYCSLVQMICVTMTQLQVGIGPSKCLTVLDFQLRWFFTMWKLLVEDIVYLKSSAQVYQSHYLVAAASRASAMCYYQQHC